MSVKDRLSHSSAPAFMPPPPGTYPPPPNGAGPRPSMPPTPIPSHAHPFYHQSPQRELFCQSCSGSASDVDCSATRHALPHDDAPARRTCAASPIRRPTRAAGPNGRRRTCMNGRAASCLRRFALVRPRSFSRQMSMSRYEGACTEWALRGSLGCCSVCSSSACRCCLSWFVHVVVTLAFHSFVVLQ